jgi:trehalose 6-phosphate phosphatase
MISCRDKALQMRLRTAERIWWFLDYDGTLADFAPNPDVILPDPELIQLVTQLASQDNMRVSIISGRRLAHIEQLLPIPGIIKAGSYGLELRLATGELYHPLAQQEIRPILDKLKKQWEKLLAGRVGFYLEDKGWTLAIHAKDAEMQQGQMVINQAQHLASSMLEEIDSNLFILLTGHRFLEIAPRIAGKRSTVEMILKQYPWPHALPVYLGDDDKDAKAFPAVQAQGGVAVGVGSRQAVARTADCRLESPTICRQWLNSFLT